MPNYCAHVFFGEKVMEQLPERIRDWISGSGSAFRIGLFGPDPITFSPGGHGTASALHGSWQEGIYDPLQTMLQGENQNERSFAAGYLCHMMLDDICHARIRRLQREKGISHQLLEVGLDWVILREGGESHFPGLGVGGSRKINRVAAKLIKPARPLQYRIGLLLMGLVCQQMKLLGPLYIKYMSPKYQNAARELRQLFDKTAITVAEQLTKLCGGENCLPELIAAASF